MNISTSQFDLCVFPEGFLILSNGVDSGIPLAAMLQVTEMLPEDSVLDTGIANFYQSTTHPRTVLAATTPDAIVKWHERIKEALALIEDPEERWVKGLEVGSSAISIFSVLASQKWRAHFGSRSTGAVPLDHSDFGRCKNLLAEFPQWRDRLSEIADAYPDGGWPTIIENWDRLEAMDSTGVSEFLHSLRKS